MSQSSFPPQLGSFRIEGVLGRGGSAVVYAAFDGARPIALKVMEDGWSEREIDRFLEEAERMRRVSHRSLVTVLRAGLLPGGRPYIAMPRLGGQTLAERLRAESIPLSRAISLFEGLVDAVSTLHEAGLIHRDIKPENIMWSTERDALVLLDLGIAQDIESAPSTTTRAGMTRGTPAYMAPERFFGKRASIASDVYELGLVLYVMLARALPWNVETPEGRMKPLRLSDHGLSLPEGLELAFQKILSVRTEDRPQTADDLLSLVVHATSGVPVGAQSMPPLEPRNPRVIVTPPSPAMALESATTRLAPLASPAVAIEARGPSGADRKARWVPLAIALAILVGSVGVGLAWWSARESTVGGLAPSVGPSDPKEPSATAEAAPSSSNLPREPASSGVSPSASAPAVTASPSSAPAPRAPGSTQSPTISVSAPAGPASAPEGSASAPPDRCVAYLALMCGSSSGALPHDCDNAKGLVAKSRAWPPDVASDACATAIQGAVVALRQRKEIPR